MMRMSSHGRMRRRARCNDADWQSSNYRTAYDQDVNRRLND